MNVVLLLVLSSDIWVVKSNFKLGVYVCTLPKCLIQDVFSFQHLIGRFHNFNVSCLCINLSGDEKNTKLISLWLGREKNIDNLYALQIETNWTNGNFVVADELQQQQHQKKWHKLNGARVSVRETETVQMCVDNANGDVFFLLSHSAEISSSSNSNSSNWVRKTTNRRTFQTCKVERKKNLY